MRDRVYIVDLNKKSYEVAKYKQYDNDIPYSIHLVENGLDVDLTGYSVKAFFERTDNVVLQKNCTINDAIISTTLDNDILALSSIVKVEFKMYKEKQIVTTFSITLTVESSINTNEAIESVPGWDIVQDILAIDENIIKPKLSEMQKDLDKFKIDTTAITDASTNKMIADVNKAIAAGTQDLEVKRARDGEIDLHTRLERDLAKGKEIFEYIEGSNISIENTHDSYVENLTIDGNTYQNPNKLEEILSVGDKVEGQSAWEIPLLCTGKNLFDGRLDINAWDNATGNIVILPNYIRSVNFTKVKPDTQYVLRNKNNKITQVQFRRKNGTLIYAITSENIITTPNNCYYISMNFADATLLDIINVQLEEGTIATPYEPYQEHELTISSPCQIEKVGDVEDRIVERDGVWGVEKNVIAKVENNILVNKQTTSQFIPLPHSQQVILRTFANKTNISFLTEIEGTIKGEVAKSKDAVINTHTTQIDNLNKELEKVKKLEESTVSIVKNEGKNFVSVAETNGGYFEDVRLDGRTLVVGGVLKSVGEGIDEIEVSSVTGNLFGGKLEVGAIDNGVDANWTSYARTSFVSVPSSTDLYCDILLYKGVYPQKLDFRLSEYDMDKNFIRQVINFNSITTSKNTSYIRIASKLESSDSNPPKIDEIQNVIINTGNAPKPHVEHKADKKRLSFLNSETQTWGKPVLTEFDEVRKNSDGVYRYYKRSITRAYAEGDETNVDCITDMTNTVEKVAEKVYECTNLDLITYPNETNLKIESGAITPFLTAKYHGNISNVVKILQKKVSLLENKYDNMFRLVLSGNMQNLARELYPEDFIEEEYVAEILPIEPM